MKKFFSCLYLSLSFAILLSACGRPVQPAINTPDVFGAAPSQVKLQTEVIVPSEQASQQQRDFISKEEALNMVLGHAGVAEKDITDLEIELDYDDDRRIWEYDISFDVGIAEYECEVNAVDGTIIEFRKDVF